MPLEVMPEANVLAQLVAWAEAEPRVRALILTSSRAKPGRASDLLSDYDVIVAVADPDALAADCAWPSAYGRPLARWGDEDELYGLATHFRGVVYEDGVKIDYSIWPVELLRRVGAQSRAARRSAGCSNGSWSSSMAGRSSPGSSASD